MSINMDTKTGARRKVGADWYRVGEVIEVKVNGETDQWDSAIITGVDRNDNDCPVKTDHPDMMWPSVSRFRKLGADPDAVIVDGRSYKLGDAIEMRHAATDVWQEGTIAQLDKHDKTQPLGVELPDHQGMMFWPELDHLRAPQQTPPDKRRTPDVSVTVITDGAPYVHAVGDRIESYRVGFSGYQGGVVIGVDPTDPSYPIQVSWNHGGPDGWVRAEDIKTPSDTDIPADTIAVGGVLYQRGQVIQARSNNGKEFFDAVVKELDHTSQTMPLFVQMMESGHTWWPDPSDVQPHPNDTLYRSAQELTVSNDPLDAEDYQAGLTATRGVATMLGHLKRRSADGEITRKDTEQALDDYTRRLEQAATHSSNVIAELMRRPVAAAAPPMGPGGICTACMGAIRWVIEPDASFWKHDSGNDDHLPPAIITGA